VTAAKSAVRDAERALKVAGKQAIRAAAKLEIAASCATESEAQRALLERQLTRAAQDAESAREQARAAEAEASDAAQAEESVEHALGLARERLKELTSGQ
jgi:hypothetical protein